MISNSVDQWLSFGHFRTTMKICPIDLKIAEVGAKIFQIQKSQIPKKHNSKCSIVSYFQIPKVR